MAKEKINGDPGSSPGMTKDGKHTIIRREMLKQVQHDIGGTYYYAM
jgi:hypothetical protein